MYAPAIFNEKARFSPMYEHARSRARLGKIKSILRGHSNRLLNLSEVTNGQVFSRHYVGLRTVPVRQIQGSESRNKDFDRDFNPVRDHTKERWINIIAARLFEKSLPAVDLIKVGEIYFVRDGHHRVSVANALGAEFIDAHVTELLIG
ncbi:MAG: hypothetical protein ACK2T5_07815 [Anaerolineales bacterium]|jgi:hypothetical protein